MPGKRKTESGCISTHTCFQTSNAFSDFQIFRHSFKDKLLWGHVVVITHCSSWERLILLMDSPRQLCLQEADSTQKKAFKLAGQTMVNYLRSKLPDELVDHPDPSALPWFWSLPLFPIPLFLVFMFDFWYLARFWQELLAPDPCIAGL